MSSSNRVRISVANLVPCFRDPETGNQCYFGILNPTIYNQEGGWQYQALGGGVLITPTMKDELETKFDARDFENGFDARFTIPQMALNDVLALFELRDKRKFELTPNREVVKELSTKKLHDIDPVLTLDEAHKLSFGYIKPVRQPLQDMGRDTSPRATQLVTHRLFHRFIGHAPYPVFEKMKASCALRVFTEAELALTEGGRHGAVIEGSCTIEGPITIANNMFPL